MDILRFQNDGVLSPGTYELTGEQFIETFCQGKERGPFRRAIQDLCDFSTSKGATRILVGGSFVSKIENPHDLDCVIVFEKESYIPERTEQLQIEGTKLDIFFCSEDQPTLLGAFAKLFTETRRIQKTGIVQINLWAKGNKPLWQVIQEPDEITLDIIKRVYFQRALSAPPISRPRRQSQKRPHASLRHSKATAGKSLRRAGSLLGQIILDELAC